MEPKEDHTCHFCGEWVNDQGTDTKGKRHYLSDCRPDLVEHEIGDTCTWAYRRKPLVISAGTPNERIEPALPIEETCYAYQDKDQNWTKDHIHFYKDGPM